MAGMSRLAFMVELVTDIVMAANGVVRSKGAGKHDIESETAWHFGFYSRPLDGARGVVLKADGQGNTSFLIGYRDKQYELTLEKGEVGVASAFDSSILLDTDGHVNVDAKSGSFVKLGGGANFVALANLVNARLDTIQGAFDAHIHSTPAGNSGVPTSLIGALADVDAQNVKAT